MASGEKQSITLGDVKAWLPVILVLVSLVVGWTLMDQRIQQVTVQQVLMATQLREFAQENTNVKVKLAEIQKDIAYIRVSLDEHMRLSYPGK